MIVTEGYTGDMAVTGIVTVGIKKLAEWKKGSSAAFFCEPSAPHIC
jgi:hypothetical protein